MKRNDIANSSTILSLNSKNSFNFDNTLILSSNKMIMPDYSSSLMLKIHLAFRFDLILALCTYPRTTKVSPGLQTRSKNLKTPFFSRYSKFLLVGNWYRSRTEPKFFSKKKFQQIRSLEPFKVLAEMGRGGQAD